MADRNRLIRSIFLLIVSLIIIIIGIALTVSIIFILVGIPLIIIGILLLLLSILSFFTGVIASISAFLFRLVSLFSQKKLEKPLKIQKKPGKKKIIDVEEKEGVFKQE